MQTKQKIVTFKTKTGHYLERLMSETIKLLGSSKNKINKDKNSYNVYQLEITEALLWFNIVNNDYRHDPRALNAFVPNTIVPNY